MPTYEASRAESRRAVMLPDQLVSRVEARLPHTEFDQPEEWIAYALEEVLARVEASADDPEPIVPEAEIERRLESLGYLDR